MSSASENVIVGRLELPTINWRPFSWPRLEFRDPGPDGMVYGFLFRLLGTVVAVIVGSCPVVLVGAFNGWSVTASLLSIQAGLTAVLVLLTEHLRSRVYERLLPDDESRLTVMADITPLPETPAPPLRRRHSSLRRFADAGFATVLLVLLAPLILLIALLVRLDSRGPVFARSPRVGKGGRQFWLLKFRTATWNSEREAERYKRRTPIRNLSSDSHVTRAGRFLRKCALDELPALLNVLQGDLSIVGPWSMHPQEMATIDPQIAKRLAALRPGLIGIWSFGGAKTTDELLLAELQFHERASIWDDAKIIGRSFLVVMHGAGAV